MGYIEVTLLSIPSLNSLLSKGISSHLSKTKILLSFQEPHIDLCGILFITVNDIIFFYIENYILNSFQWFYGILLNQYSTIHLFIHYW